MCFLLLKMKVPSFIELTAKTAGQYHVLFLIYGPEYRVLFSTSVEHIAKMLLHAGSEDISRSAQTISKIFGMAPPHPATL